MAIYLKLGDIVGNVTHTDNKEWIALDNCAFACHRPISQIVGEVANRSRATPQITTITAGKKTDVSSEGLMRAAISKTAGVDAEIHYVVNDDDNKYKKIQSIKLKNVIVASYNQSASSEGDPYESLELSFSNIEADFNPSDATGKTAGSPKLVKFDLATGEAG